MQVTLPPAGPHSVRQLVDSAAHIPHLPADWMAIWWSVAAQASATDWPLDGPWRLAVMQVCIPRFAADWS